MSSLCKYVQEYTSFKKFVDSLLSRSSKLGDQISVLDSYKECVEEKSVEMKRIDKSPPYKLCRYIK